jgi:predicted transcriptional regulator
MVAKKDLCSLTRISYGANMPVDRAKKVVTYLVSHGFLREVATDNRKGYRTTRWGLEYLETFKRMRKFFAALEEE